MTRLASVNTTLQGLVNCTIDPIGRQGELLDIVFDNLLSCQDKHPRHPPSHLNNKFLVSYDYKTLGKSSICYAHHTFWPKKCFIPLGSTRHIRWSSRN